MKSVRATEIFDALLRWYEDNKRILPWRENASPYRVWVSEIMLQQTRVETVKNYFLRWMMLFPTLHDLAIASEDEVLKAWEGLGYYSRARNLHKAAKIVDRDYGGELPKNREALRMLPGIGDYTVGAVLSIAFGEKEPAVDGNVLRVISRLQADPSDVSKSEVRKRIADELRPLMPEGKTSEFTQALFEIGALICLPGDGYRCDVCPVRAYCRAAEQGKQKDYPVKTEKAKQRVQERTVLLVCHDERYALRKRPDKGLLANLYEFPNEEGHLRADEVKGFFQDPSAIISVEALPDATHVFTHLIWEMKGYLVRLAEEIPLAGVVWASPSDIGARYTLPSAFSAYKKLLK